MARLAPLSNSSSRANSPNDSLYRTPSVQPPSRLRQSHTPANAASPSSGSDKENNQARRAAIKAGKMPAVADQGARGPKRRRLGERDSVQYESAGSEEEAVDNARDNVETREENDEEEEQSDELVEEVDEENATIHNDRTPRRTSGPQYDPQQSMAERRELRKGLRELDKEMQDSGNEWITPESNALQEAVMKQNQLFGNVKQTSDATIDSRLLVNAGDLTYKRTRNLNMGESGAGIDLDQFVGKCMTFMRDMAGESRAGVAMREDEADEDDQGNALDWAALGKYACFPANIRPPTIGFLMGPLSIQHKTKPQTQRRERLQKSGPMETVKAKELRAEDLANPENAGLVDTCNKIKLLFDEIHEEGIAALQQFWAKKEEEGVTPEEEKEFDEWNYILNDGGVHFFKFLINPTSFGQSAENLFYFSFLVRDDTLKIQFDEETQLPSIHPIPEEVRTDRERAKGTRHQAVFGLDFPTWERLVDVFNITDSMIPDRSAEYAAAPTQVQTNGWYN